MFFTCVFTVLTEMYIRAAISTCDRVPCRYRSTVLSRLVSGSTKVPVVVGAAFWCSGRCSSAGHRAVGGVGGGGNRGGSAHARRRPPHHGRHPPPPPGGGTRAR